MGLKIVEKVAEENRLGCDVENLVALGDQLFTNGENGTVKVWSAKDLSLTGELTSTRGGVCALLTHGNRLYAAMADSTIVIWDVDTKTVIKELTGHEDAVKVMRVHGDRLYSGDYAGKILVWENDSYCCSYEMYEEVWDLVIRGEVFYTSRDRDLTMHTLGRKEHQHLTNLHAVEGHGPICIAGDRLCFLTRDGLSIRVHDNTKHSFPEITTVKPDSRIINALTCNADGTRLYSGGWDCHLRSWDVSSMSQLSQLSTEVPINTICVHNGAIYVGGNSGLLVKITDE